jgi:hypothetical protein
LPFLLLTPWLTATALSAAAMIFERRTINPAHAGIVMMCWIASIRVSRLDAFFVLSAVMLLGPEIRAVFRRFVPSSPAPVAALPGGARNIALGAVAIGLLGTAISHRNFTCVEIQEDSFPEPQAVQSAKLKGMRGRMLTFFDWGEYAIWHLGPGVKVSMDGRRETVYSQETIDRHFALYSDRPGAIDFVQELQPDYIWLPTRLSVVNTLRTHGWKDLFSGPRSVILTRTGGAADADHAQPSKLQTRCFPGP